MFCVSVEELWKHRNEVKHEPPRVQPKFSEKKSLSPEELEQLGHLKCNACGKILPSRRLLRRHFYSDHRECMPGPSCAVCGVEFKTRQELWKHKREMKHNDSLSLLQTYQCEECGKILTGGYHSFKLHQKFACKDTEEAPCSKCDICGGMFKSQTHVQQHKNRTHIDLPVVCDICGTVCKNKHALNSHKRRHDEKNKKFACSNCGKAFLTNILLQMHIRTHTKEKPFKCPLCDYRCAIKQNIQKHSVNVHKTQVKCTDIVTISGNRLHEASKEIAQHENKVRNGKTSNSNRKDLKIPPEGKLLSDDMASIPSDRMSDFNKISYNLNGTESMPSDRVLLPNVKTFVKNGTAENIKPLTLDRPFLSNDKGENFSANRNKSYPFNDIESAYDLTMCRQNAISGSGHDAGKVTVNNENPLANLTTIKETSAGSYTELINCTVNPMSYALANLDPTHYHHQWGNPSNR